MGSRTMPDSHAHFRGFHALVPVKAPSDGKSRLASVLSSAERRELNRALARQAIEACAQFFGAERTQVITASAAVERMAIEARVHVVQENLPPAGLNEALALGAEHAIGMGAQGLVVVPTDLALLSAEALEEAMAQMPDSPGCLVVPDRRGTGTNLLALSPARGDLFAFGAFSPLKHADMAAREGCEVRVFRSAALGLDLDLPEDYVDWRRLEDIQRRQQCSGVSA